jgi:hypothetical protein
VQHPQVAVGQCGGLAGEVVDGGRRAALAGGHLAGGGGLQPAPAGEHVQPDRGDPAVVVLRVRRRAGRRRRAGEREVGRDDHRRRGRGRRRGRLGRDRLGGRGGVEPVGPGGGRPGQRDRRGAQLRVGPEVRAEPVERGDQRGGQLVRHMSARARRSLRGGCPLL